MHDDGGDDLRVFVQNQLCHRRRIHPLQAFDAAGVAAHHDAVNQITRLVVTQRVGQHGAQVFIRVQSQGRFFFGSEAKGAQHLVDLFTGNRLQIRHRRAEFLHLARTQVLEHFARAFFSQRQQQNGAALQTFVIHPCSPIP